jgi:histidinol phosphatase-like enzyme (inositol monophosphatase family)
MDLTTELAFAREIALLGGRIALDHQRRRLQRRQKADGSWVTEADWKVEAQLRLRIARTFPNHNVLGEEEGLTAAGGGEPAPGAPTWVLDPIDGTNNFMAQIPIWGTLVGLRIDERSVLGVCNLPALNECYDAAVGMGARMNGEAIRVDPIDELGAATISHGGSGWFHKTGLAGFLDEVVSRASRTRGFGDCWGHALVARGAVHAMIEPSLRLWDFCALEPIVTEAGGRVTRIDGSELTDGGSVLSTNAALHDELVRLAKATTPGWVEV